MVHLTSLFSFGLMAGAAVASPIMGGNYNETKPRKCGEVDVFYTGLPPWHKKVVEQGLPPQEAEDGIKNSLDIMVKAGYNVKMYLAGPERPIEEMREAMDGRHWDVTGIGFGQRASNDTETTGKFEQNLMLFREQGPMSPTVFNTNPWTFLWSIERYAPLESDCADQPGTDYGYEAICDDDYCLTPDDLEDDQ